MESSQPSLLAQARQGDAKAIATLLNQKLQPKGITAKASIKNSCLHIMLEAAKTPQQQPLVDFISKGLAGLAVDDWCAVKVYGRQADEEIPDWVEEFKIRRETNQDSAILAKQGDVKAISTLINQKLQANRVIAKVSAKNDCFQVMLEATEVPNQEQMVLLLQSEFQKLGVPGISTLRLYGKQSGEDFPDWQEEIKLLTGKMKSQEVQPISLKSSFYSEEIKHVQTVSVIQEVDGIRLSNQLYITIQTTCYQHLAYKVGAEDDKTIHEIVEDFVDGLETDLKRDLDQFAKQSINISKPFGLQLDSTAIKAIVSNAIDADFAGVRLAIRDLERVTREVLQTDFPQETDALKSFFAGAAQEFTAQFFGMTAMGKEAVIGATIGMVAGPLGSVVGGAIGGWLAGNKQQKSLEALIGKYQKARFNLFQEWEILLQLIYAKLIDSLSETASVRLLDYQVMDQSIEFYHQGNEHLEEDLEKAIEFYDKAIRVNPGLTLAWNNKGYSLNQLKKFEEALPVLAQAVQLDRTLAISLNNFGDCLQGLGRNQEAISTYEESIKLEPDNYQAWWGKGTCLYNLSKYQEATTVAQKLTELDPENFLGWYAKSSFNALVGNKELALESLREAVRIDSDSSQRLAKSDPDFNHLWEDEQFKELMESSVGVSYTSLKEYLKQKQWREADRETALVIKEVIQKVANSTEVNQEALKVFPCTDLETIDSFWLEYSEGRFGFSVQKRIFQESFKDKCLFGIKNGWRIKDANGNWTWRCNSDFSYDSEKIPDGHLPSSLWSGVDGWFENRRDRLIALFTKIDSCSMGEKDRES
ncbi:GUN4 domain-containing protein [Nodosilinea sp. AN01ver1]|uniref:GUN4 domain-containing protein n=1 Tax=Nodosilinea sp. AN01ver1 TaxID=3423362 RepID=UPI003D31BE0D